MGESIVFSANSANREIGGHSDGHETAEQMMARKWRSYFGHCEYFDNRLNFRFTHEQDFRFFF